MNRLGIAVSAVAMVVSSSIATTGAAYAGDTIKLQASSRAGDWAMQFYQTWVDKFNAMTGPDGTKMEVLPTQAVVPYKETIDAVANGILSGDLNAISYFTGRDQAFSILGDLISGYDTVDQMQTFCQYGGGKEILQKVYDKYTGGNTVVIGCGPYAREAFVSAIPIETIDDLEGVKLRSPEGLAAEVFKRAGASPVALPFSEVYTVWYTAMNTSMRRKADLEDKRLVAEHKAGGDITVIDWAQEDRDKMRAIAVEAWEDVAAKSPLAREALDAHIAFMKQIGLLD